MAMRSLQAISGVSAGVENVVMTVYPSISATGLGRLIGRACDMVPLRINGIPVWSVLLAPLTIPLSLLLYVVSKINGDRYVLTNRRVAVRAVLNERQVSEFPLTSIGSIEIEQLDGQQFFHAADLVICDAGGSELGRLPAVPRPDIFRQTILETRDALMQTEAALATIAARQPA